MNSNDAILSARRNLTLFPEKETVSASAAPPAAAPQAVSVAAPATTETAAPSPAAAAPAQATTATATASAPAAGATEAPKSPEKKEEEGKGKGKKEKKEKEEKKDKKQEKKEAEAKDKDKKEKKEKEAEKSPAASPAKEAAAASPEEKKKKGTQTRSPWLTLVSFWGPLTAHYHRLFSLLEEVTPVSCRHCDSRWVAASHRVLACKPVFPTLLLCRSSTTCFISVFVRSVSLRVRRRLPLGQAHRTHHSRQAQSRLSGGCRHPQAIHARLDQRFSPCDYF